MTYKVPILFWIFLLTHAAHAQPRYTPIRHAYSLEAFGASQGIQFALETPFRYRRSSFFDIQAGLGLYRQAASVSTASYAYSLGSALTHCLLLNRRRTICDPRPEYHRWEYYFETGLVGTLFPDRYSLSVPDRQVVRAAAQALAGIRIHFNGAKNTRILKIRFTPFLAPGFPPWAGIAYGVGLW